MKLKFNKKIFLLLAFLFIFSIFCFLVFKNKSFPESSKEIIIKDTKFFVEIADTPGKQEKGLSGRDFLPENQGMLFVFDRPDYYAFWMKEMKFPLDFVWIKENEVVEISKNIKPEDFQPPKILRPKTPVDKVLEINGGLAERFGIKPGEKVILK